MTILVVTWNFPPRRGGIEYLISNLCAGLREKHSVLVITAHGQVPQPGENDIFRAPWPGLIPFALYVIWRGATLLRSNPGTEVIFGGSVLVAPLVLILACLFGRRAVLQTHGLDVVYSNKLYQALCVHWLRFFDRVIANSAFTAFLLRKRGVSTDLVSVIPPGVYPERFQAGSLAPERVRKHFNIVDQRIVLFVGRLAKRKGVTEFIRYSLGRITKEFPDACLVVVGDNPTESLIHRNDTLREIELAISETGLANHVRLMGSLSDTDVAALYQACDVVILPALDDEKDVEGFGIVLIEAAAAGKAAVATRVGGIPDAIEDGKTGLLTEPGDYQRLSDAVVSLLKDGRTKQLMGEAAMRRAQEKFCWPKITAQYETAFGFSKPNHTNEQPRRRSILLRHS
jgi:phosphatidylinositol alpha-1,6-mannosyltransferase